MGERHPLPSGTRLSDAYVIEDVLGAGGFGITYAARDLHLDTRVAIKEYFPNLIAGRVGSGSIRWSAPSNEQTFRWGLDKFVKEARTLVQFRHPAIVRVFRIFPANDTAYIVMEFVEGRDMEKWLATLQGPPTQDQFDRLLEPLLDALEIVHKNKVLHRDIKPANIYIRDTGLPVLLDFGSARPEEPEHSVLSSAVISRFYSPFEAYGTVSAQQGPWTDIYGLAATLHHALTGAPPPDALNRISADDYRPLAGRPEFAGSYRPRFLAAIDAGLQVLPRDRPRKVADWRPQLFDGRVGKRGGNRWSGRAAAAGLAAMVAGGAFFMHASDSGPPGAPGSSGTADTSRIETGSIDRNLRPPVDPGAAEREAERQRLARIQDEIRRERERIEREREDLERQRQDAENRRRHEAEERRLREAEEERRQRAEAERELERIERERRREAEARRRAEEAAEFERQRIAALEAEARRVRVERQRRAGGRVESATGVMLSMPDWLWSTAKYMPSGRGASFAKSGIHVDTLRFLDMTDGDCLAFRMGNIRNGKNDPDTYRLDASMGEIAGSESSEWYWVRMEKQGGECRGLSVVVSRSASRHRDLMQKIKDSFIAFP